MSDPEWIGWLASIRAAPDDDAPRLAMADWLDERGESVWAELIRVQVALARWPDLPVPVVCRSFSGDRKSFQVSQRDAARLRPGGWVWALDRDRRSAVEGIVVEVGLIGPVPLSGGGVVVFIQHGFYPRREELGALRKRQDELLKLIRKSKLAQPNLPAEFPIRAADALDRLHRHRPAEEPDDPAGVEFDRGFVSRVTCQAWWWRAYGCRLVDRHPVQAVRLIRLLDYPQDDPEFSRWRTEWPEIPDHGWWLPSITRPEGEVTDVVTAVTAGVASEVNVRLDGRASNLRFQFVAYNDASRHHPAIVMGVRGLHRSPQPDWDGSITVDDHGGDGPIGEWRVPTGGRRVEVVWRSGGWGELSGIIATHDSGGGDGPG